MRSFENASLSWQELKQCQTLAELKEAVRLDGRTSAATTGLRSACWKAFLLFDSIDTSEWSRTLSSSRSAYNSLRLHYLRDLEDPDDADGHFNSLSEDAESSSRNASQKDEEIREEILQDVDRCMPENLYFRQPETRRMLLDILFVFCKLNPDIGYRQGMHELLAPIVWVVERDAIELGPSSKAMGEDAIIKTVFDADYIEHDAFALFAQVMQSAKGFYEQTTHDATDNPIVTRSKRIFDDILPQVDRELAVHLHNIDVVPQVFLMRWIRLLFGREFGFDEMLTVWDVLFAEDTTLNLVNEICVVMLLRIRWELLDGDYNTALTLLLRYPALEKEHTAQSLALDGLYLRDHKHSEGGSSLVLKYTGRPLISSHRSVTPPALQRNMTTFSGDQAAKAAASVSPLRRGHQPRNIEAMFQSTARNIYARGESLGIGKVVRSAVDEVHKKAQEIRDAQTRSSPARRTPRAPVTGPGAVYARVGALEARNKQLSKLLEGAVGELWDYQKLVTDGGGSANAERASADAAEKLSVAIAKLQFVQVYLSDSSLSLPEADGPDQAGSEEKFQIGTDEGGDGGNEKSESATAHQDQAAASLGTDPSRSNTSTAADPGALHGDTVFTSEDTEKPADPYLAEAPADEHSISHTIPEQAPSQPTPDVTSAKEPLSEPDQTAESTQTLKPRPALEQSSFSWMLETDNDSTTTRRPLGGDGASAFPPEPARNRGFLFGDEDPEASPETVVYSPRRKAGRERRHKKVASVSSAAEGSDLNRLQD